MTNANISWQKSKEIILNGNSLFSKYMRIIVTTGHHILKKQKDVIYGH